MVIDAVQCIGAQLALIEDFEEILAAMAAQEAVDLHLGAQRKILGTQIDEELPFHTLFQQCRYAAQFGIHQTVSSPQCILALEHRGIGIVAKE